MNLSTKQALYHHCREYIDKRIQSSRQVIGAAQQAANEETKSSSGDKHETGRAMMQLEIEKNSQQLLASLKVKKALDQIRIDNPAASVQPGSLVVTDREIFFVAISLGKVTLCDQTYIVIAADSPLGLQFMGAKKGDRIIFRDQSYLLQELI